MPVIDLEIMVDCFRIDWGFFSGELGLMLIELFLVALNFFSISRGIGFIITFEFFLGILSISSSFSPQEINLETVIISF